MASYPTPLHYTSQWSKVATLQPGGWVDGGYNKQRRLTAVLSIWCVMVPGRSLNVIQVVLMLWNGTKGCITHVLCILGTVYSFLST